VIGDKASTHGGMVSINKMREYLSEMEKIGSNYVRIGFHSDHNELEIVGVSYTKSTQEEIDAYLEKEIKVKEARKQARIAELQAEMDRIKSL
jgi:dissimilatory sulfite reductase (desulfoviridin) alpha/beta subunit